MAARQQWQEALAAFVAAAQHPQGRGVRELLDACAIAALLLGRNHTLTFPLPVPPKRPYMPIYMPYIYI